MKIVNIDGKKYSYFLNDFSEKSQKARYLPSL